MHNPPHPGEQSEPPEDSRESWQRSQVEAALIEADAGDFVPEKEMAAKFNRLGKRKKAETDGWARDNYEAIQELNRIVEDRGLFSDDHRAF